MRQLLSDADSQHLFVRSGVISEAGRGAASHLSEIEP